MPSSPRAFRACSSRSRLQNRFGSGFRAKTAVPAGLTVIWAAPVTVARMGEAICGCKDRPRMSLRSWGLRLLRRQKKPLVSICGDFPPRPHVLGEPADVRHEHARLAGNVGAEIPGAAGV